MAAHLAAPPTAQARADSTPFATFSTAADPSPLNPLAGLPKNLLYLCIKTAENRNQKMARPIKETPILFGKDAKRFEERMKNPPKESVTDRHRREANYRAAMSMFVK